jgi:hypothetical protein
MTSPPDDRDSFLGLRDWRMGPWRDRSERWDLVPVSDLGMGQENWSALFLAGIFTAGRLADALGRREGPSLFRSKRARREAERALKPPALRSAAISALEAIVAQAEPDRSAIEAAIPEASPIRTPESIGVTTTRRRRPPVRGVPGVT